MPQWENSSSAIDFSFLVQPRTSPPERLTSNAKPAVRDVWLLTGPKAPKNKSRKSHSSYVEALRAHQQLLKEEGVVSRRTFVSKTLDLAALGISRKRVPSPPPPLPSTPTSISSAPSGGVGYVPMGFFTSNTSSPLAQRRQPVSRQPRLPPPPRIHDFHNGPFDPTVPLPAAPSAFALRDPAEPHAGRQAPPLPSYVVVESLSPTPPAPPSTLFRSASRPLAFVNPAARRTASEIIGPEPTPKVAARKAPAPKPVLQALSIKLDGTAEETWGQYVEATPAGFPSSLLSDLFESQSSLADAAVRRERLVNIAVRATALEGEAIAPPLSLAQLRLAFEAGLDIGEAEELAYDDGETARSQKLSRREDVSVVLREIWRSITAQMEQGSDGLAWAESQELIWRWVGLLAWTGPGGPADLAIRSYARPQQRADRVDDLALFLDKIGSPSVDALTEFARYVARGWVNEGLVRELQEAAQHVTDVRSRRDDVLVQSKTFDARVARRKLWAFLQEAYGGRKGVDTTAIEGWVEMLLVAPNPKDAAQTPPAKLSPAEAISLSSRWTSAMLLVRNLVQSERPLPASSIWHLYDALSRLKSASEDHRVSLHALRALTSTILQASPDMSILAPRQHYDLLLEFIAREDLPFARRLYQAFRLRERQFAFAADVTLSLLRLAVGHRRTEASPVETSFKSDPAFAGAVYDDRMAWGAPALEGTLLFSVLYIVGRESKLGGLATRVLSDSIVMHGPDVMTDEVAFSLARSARERVVQAIRRASDSSNGPTAKERMTSAASSFCVLPLIRGCYKELGRPPPVAVFNDLLALAAEHPTPYNTQAAVAEFTTMVNHGPAPDTETFNILIRMHLGIRLGTDGLASVFNAVEPCQPQINLVRAITLFKTMVVRQRLQPDSDTFDHFLTGLLKSDQPEAAFECFRHAMHLELMPQHASVLMLVRALVDRGLHSQANTVVTSLERARANRPPVQMEAADMKSLSDVVLSTIFPTVTVPPPALFDEDKVAHPSQAKPMQVSEPENEPALA